MNSLLKYSRIIHRIIPVVLMGSCTNISPLSNNILPGERNTVSILDYKESRIEWWYFSGLLTDDHSKHYFFQYTLFSWDRFGIKGFAQHKVLTDLTTGEHHFEENKYHGHRKLNFDNGLINIPGTTIRYDNEIIKLNSSGKTIDLELIMEISDRNICHGKNSIISMGESDNSLQDSYYFSNTDIKVKGEISMDDKKINSGNRISVKGSAWFDRQWGNFEMIPWQWFSIHFNDGDVAMLYYFPETGHKEGTLITKDGNVKSLSDYEILPDIKSGRKRNHKMNWKVFLPFRDGCFSIIPACLTPYHRTLYVINYWEGLCWLFDEDGNKIGWCVAEVVR